MAAGEIEVEPLVDREPDHAFDAVQAVAFTLDQVSVADCPTVMEEGETEIETAGADVTVNVTVTGGGGGRTDGAPFTFVVLPPKAMLATYVPAVLGGVVDIVTLLDSPWLIGEILDKEVDKEDS